MSREPQAHAGLASLASDAASVIEVPIVEVPVVDLTGLGGEVDAFDEPVQVAASRKRETARALCDALATFGFVRLVGHGIAHEQLERVDGLFSEFFAWPEERKTSVSGVAAGGQRGYTAFGREHARGRDRPDPKAFYHVGQPAPRGEFATDLLANVFPEDLADLRDASLSLFAALERASTRLLEAIEIGLMLDSGTLTGMIEGGNSILRALHYPALDPEAFAEERCESDELFDAAGLPVVLRAAPHEDINLVTLLPASDEPGLEILWQDPASGSSRWLGVPARAGEIVADVGDMLARFTGGRLPATTHRVVVTPETARRDRTAYPFFAHPRPECDLSVHSAFVPDGADPPWPSITAGDYLAERLREIGLVDD